MRRLHKKIHRMHKRIKRVQKKYLGFLERLRLYAGMPVGI